MSRQIDDTAVSSIWRAGPESEVHATPKQKAVPATQGPDSLGLAKAEKEKRIGAMKTSRTLIGIPCLLGISAALVAVGCSKKSETPPSPTPAPAEAPATTAPAPSTTTSAAPASDPMKAAGDSMNAMKQEATKTTEAAASETPATTPPKADTGAGGTMAGAASMASDQANEMKATLETQAPGMFAQYSDELASLQEKVTALKGMIDKNSSMLPAGLNEKYQELNGLLPELSSMVSSLKNYQSADLTTLVPKLKDDFGKAQRLYTEIKAMLPQS